MSIPVIQFSDQLPRGKNIFYPTSGSSHVTVVSVSALDVSSVGLVTANDTTYNFGIFDDSIGEIANLTQTTANIVDFDVVNILNYGSIVVSAVDLDTSAVTISADTNWNYSPEANKLISLTTFLPDSQIGTDVEPFTKFFEDFLNTMYEDRDDNTNKSILQKIDSIRDFNDPAKVDMDYINFFARKLGYDVDLTRGELGLFSTSGASDYEDLTDAEKVNADKYLRLVVENLPHWYKIKTTKNAIKVMLFSFGIIGDIITRFSDDYDQNWLSSIESDTVNVVDELPTSYFPTPHFDIQVDITETEPIWIGDIGKIIDAINSIRPVNTVFDNITGLYIFGVEYIDVYAGVNISYSIYVENEFFTTPGAGIQDVTSGATEVQDVTSAAPGLQDIT